MSVQAAGLLGRHAEDEGFDRVSSERPFLQGLLWTRFSRSAKEDRPNDEQPEGVFERRFISVSGTHLTYALSEGDAPIDRINIGDIIGIVSHDSMATIFRGRNNGESSDGGGADGDGRGDKDAVGPDSQRDDRHQSKIDLVGGAKTLPALLDEEGVDEERLRWLASHGTEGVNNLFWRPGVGFRELKKRSFKIKLGHGEFIVVTCPKGHHPGASLSDTSMP